jgi:hypothetical protein
MEIAHDAGVDRYMVARRLPDLERDGLVDAPLCASAREPPSSYHLEGLMNVGEPFNPQPSPAPL